MNKIKPGGYVLVEDEHEIHRYPDGGRNDNHMINWLREENVRLRKHIWARDCMIGGLFGFFVGCVLFI